MVAIRNRLSRVEAAIRQPPRLQVKQLTDATLMGSVKDGQGLRYTQTRGVYYPCPILAELVFDYVGTVAAGSSPPLRSRIAAQVIGAYSDLGGGSGTTYRVLVNGTSLATLSAPGNYQTFPGRVIGPNDRVTVSVVSPGSGADLIVHVCLTGNA